MFEKDLPGRRYARLQKIMSLPFTRRHLAGAVCLAMGAGGMAAAQTADNGPLDMAGAVRAAIATHPSVRGAGEQVGQANAEVDAARAGYKPQITGGIENQINSYRNTSYDSRNVYTARLTGSQLVYDFGKVAGGVRKAESGVRAREAQVEQATDEVALNTAQAWVDAHLQQLLVQISREQLSAVMSITALVTERVAKGATSRSDMEQAHSRVEAMRSQLLGAEAEALRASLTLMHLTGRTAPVAITGDIPAELQSAACRDGAEADTPAVRAASARRDEARADLDVARAQRYPTVTLDGSVGQALTNGSRLYGEYRTTGQIGLNLSMPFYQGGRVQAQERGAIHQLRAYEDAVRQARLETAQGFADARAQFDGWAQREPVLQTRVASIDATRDLYRQQYLQLGTRSLLDLLNAEQEYHSARIDQAQGLHMQYRLAVQCLYFSDRMRSTFRLDEARPVYGPTMSGGRGR
ncbi:MAG: TolC family outer membrane protein [Gemmatimonadaceae bacterium]|nr:TolC family outer membrane protein [Gemmatimonadaceae bacterium]